MEEYFRNFLEHIDLYSVEHNDAISVAWNNQKPCFICDQHEISRPQVLHR
jgi:hypothetical protein